MLAWILQRIILSLLFIITIHYIYIFLKDNLTTPKIKDLVNKPKSQYKEIYDSLHKNKNNKDSATMKNELQNYFQTLSKTKNNDKVDSKKKQNNNIIKSSSDIKDFSFSSGGGLQYDTL